VFSISEGLFTSIGCLKVRPLTRSTTRRFWQSIVDRWDKKDLKCGRRAHGFFTMTTWQHTTYCLSRRFWRSTRSPCWNIHPTHLT
jgi:ribosomal protein L39E